MIALDIGGDGHADLVVGAPGEDIGGMTGPNAGYVFVFISQEAPYPSYGFGQDAGANESQDRFGSSFATGNFNNDGTLDLFIGAPGEDFRGSGVNSGVVYFRQMIDPHMGVMGQDAGTNESGDRFAAALASGDFDGNGVIELVIGAPGEDYQGSGADSGVIFVWR